jgi:hypothetical protein
MLGQDFSDSPEKVSHLGEQELEAWGTMQKMSQGWNQGTL